MKLTDYIYVNKNSLCKELCDDIIELFEKIPNKYYGIVSSGYDKQVKNTVDFSIPLEENNIDYKLWSNIKDTLIREIRSNIKEYVEKINNSIDIDKNYLPSQKFAIRALQIQKYTKKEGDFKYHHDESVMVELNLKRYIVFIFYLNTVNNGGETEINMETRIKPECGKLLLFPASWVYPHTGIMPIDNDKYIITGWIEGPI